MGGCEACGTALRLSNWINEPVSVLGSLLYICCSNCDSGETNISGKIRPTVAPEPREGFKIVFPFCLFYVILSIVPQCGAATEKAFRVHSSQLHFLRSQIPHQIKCILKLSVK